MSPPRIDANLWIVVRPLVVRPLVVCAVVVSLLGSSCATLFGNPREEAACENAKSDVTSRFGDVTIHKCLFLEAKDGAPESVWVELEVLAPRDISFSEPVSDEGMRRGRQILEEILTGSAPASKANDEATRLRGDAAVCPQGRCPEADLLENLAAFSGVDPLAAVTEENARDLAIARFLFRAGRPLEAAQRIKRTATLDAPAPGARPLFARSLGRLGDVDTAADLLAKDAAAQTTVNEDLLDDLFYLGAIAVETPYMTGRRLELAIAAWERYLVDAPESPRRPKVEAGLTQLKKRRTEVEAPEPGDDVRLIFSVPAGDEVGAAPTETSGEVSTRAARFVPLVPGESYEVRGKGEIQLVRFFADWRGYGPAALVQERAGGDVRHRLVFALSNAVERLSPRAIELELKPRFVAKIR